MKSQSHPAPSLILEAAKATLARARAAEAKIDPRVLDRFEKKLRMTEAAVARKAGQTTSDGLGAVLARAEKSAGGAPRTADQARALEVLRAEVRRREEGIAKDGASALTLARTLAADAARLDALAARTPSTPKKPKSPKSPAKKTAPARPPKKASAAR